MPFRPLRIRERSAECGGILASERAPQSATLAAPLQPSPSADVVGVGIPEGLAEDGLGEGLIARHVRECSAGRFSVARRNWLW